MLIGRRPEITALENALSSDKAEMIAVIGRRRVGKTFLIEEVLGEQIIFRQTGVRHAPADRQLRTFANNLSLLIGGPAPELEDWLDAFFQLRKVLEEKISKGQKVVIFFDELSWLATPEKNFLDYLAHFWNDWAHRQNLVLVLCGSVSSWIINRVINDKGGLHNRITRYLHLKPFTCAETAEFLHAKNIKFPPRQIFQLYMAIGGIPLYLEDIRAGHSVAESLDQLCFSQTGLLREEFSRLYPALFDDAHLHTEVIRALAAAPRGLTRSAIIANSALPNGGTTTRVLEELEQSDFIQAIQPFGNKKSNKIYRLVDEYSLFYLRFIEHNRLVGEGTWLQLAQTPAYKIWSGYAFESLCFKHIARLKASLGVSSVYTTVSAFAKRGEPGVQVDLVLQRADEVINLCEAKFHKDPYALTAARVEELEERTLRFRTLSKTRLHVIPTLIVGGAFRENDYSSSSGFRIVRAEEWLAL